MSTSRLFSVFVALMLVIVVVLTIRAGIATSEVVSSPKAALDQHERHVDLAATATIAEQARLEYRGGEWKAGTAAARANATLDQHDRHPSRPLPDNRTCVLCGGQ